MSESFLLFLVEVVVVDGIAEGVVVDIVIDVGKELFCSLFLSFVSLALLVRDVSCTFSPRILLCVTLFLITRPSSFCSVSAS